MLDAFDQGFGSVAPMAAWTAQQVVKTAYEIHHQTQIPYIKIEGGGDIFLPKSDMTLSSKPIPKVSIDPDKQKKMRYRDTLIQATVDGEITRQKWQDMLALRDELGLETSVYHDIEEKLWSGTTLDDICTEYLFVPKAAPSTPKQSPRVKPTLSDNMSLDCGGVDLKLVLIPVGEFMMGSSESEGSDDEHPQHKVKITKPFYMGIYPVTQAQYKAVMGENPSHFKGSENPVETVPWHDASKFCEELSVETDKEVWLPTEAQWEYACRAGTTTVYSFGNANSKLSRYAWYSDNSGDETHPVGKKKPNPWGLHDMHGNVWEWCSDWHANDVYTISERVDPVGPFSGIARVLRGGYWDDSEFSCRSADRRRDFPDYSRSIIGFRVVVSVSSLDF